MSPSVTDIVKFISILAPYCGLDIQASLRQCEKESSFRIDAHNQVSDAYGLFQLKAATARQMHMDRMNWTENVFAALKYMRWLKQECHFTDRQAYAAYNWGCGNLMKLVAQYPDAWEAHLPSETAAYVKFILPA